MFNDKTKQYTHAAAQRSIISRFESKQKAYTWKKHVEMNDDR